MTPFWVALVVTLLLTAALVPLLGRVGLHDVPNDRSSHATPTPRGGGLAVLAGIAAGAASGAAAPSAWLVVGAAILLGAVGLVDDARSLPSSVRLLAQLVVGGALGVGLALAGMSGRGDLVAVAVTTLAVAAYVNAFNFMDGVNGMSALNTLVAGGWFAWLGHDRDLQTVALLGAVAAGASLGFLPWNASGRIFLGDVGSYGLGALVAATGVLAWVGGAPALLVLAPVLVYLADTGWALVTRARRGHRLTEAHRDHVYQRVLGAGWGHLASAGWTAGLGTVVCLVVATTEGTSPALAAAAAALLVVGYLSTPRALALRRTVQGGGR